MYEICIKPALLGSMGCMCVAIPFFPDASLNLSVFVRGRTSVSHAGLRSHWMHIEIVLTVI